MKDFAEILSSHAARYPLSKPVDVVKLIYQSVFCGGHMIADETSAIERLKIEYNSISHEEEEIVESLGECVRYNIDHTMSERQLELLGRLFYLSVGDYPVGYESADEAAKRKFIERIECAKQLAEAGKFAFNADEFNEYIEKYMNIGCPAISHSDEYHYAYKPAYRVIDSRRARLFNCICKIDELIRCNTNKFPIIVAIDGRAASGKTTSAKLIAEFFGDTEIVHMDDFFLPNELRTQERLNEAGGNLHRERYIDEVLAHIHDTEGFSYRVFDCSTRDYKATPRMISKAKLIVCEGAYSLHPAFGDYHDIAIFSTITPDEQECRILSRNGDEMLEHFKSMWIPMEEKYFEAFDIEKKCDIII
ncbi:MAG: hypothetical protein HFE63_00190 [Clostridiales bacterium]|nr:hypothetical protein [Clostridiales bacterium]